MKIDTKYLYELLPAYYRVIDAEQGGALEAFISILAREGRIVEENITQLYENWFIETCDEWVVPYIGDLLGVKGIHEIEDPTVYSRRAYIANTLSYRRRKGTAPVLEQIAFDITGWRSKVVEFFQLLSTTQNLNHVRLHNTVTPDLRRMNSLDLINTAFDKQSHTIDVRRIEPGLGLYNIMNIGIYLWRLQSYPLGDSYNTDPSANNDSNRYLNAREVLLGTGEPTNAYTFNPLGLDTQLFNNPEAERDIDHLAEEINVPGLLRRRGLHDELEQVRQKQVDGETPDYTFFEMTHPPVFQIFIEEATGIGLVPIPREEIVICNLSTWHLPPLSREYKRYEPNGSISTIAKGITVAVDPVLGRIVFHDAAVIDPVLGVQVNYNYGFSGDLGGGPYDRKTSLQELEDLDVNWQVGVSKDLPAVQGETIHTTLWQAIDEWNTVASTQPQIQVGLITVMDNRTYEEDLTGALRIRVPEGKKLFIVAADWPERDDPTGGPGVKYRPLGSLNPEDIRPHLLGDVEIEGIGSTGSSNGGGLLLNGLLIEGKVTVLNGSLDSCQIDHCTLVPYKGGLEVEPQTGIISVGLERSISGAVNVAAEDAVVSIDECIVDHKTGSALAVTNGQLAIERSTIYGEVRSQSLDASNSIFMDILDIERRQIGCVRFSYVPEGSNVPRRYRCQPDLEIQTQIKELEESAALAGQVVSVLERQMIRDQIRTWLFPVFNSNSYRQRQHAYAQLGDATPEQITTGGDNGSEMGAFNYLQQAQRAANLKNVLKEYLRLGLEAGTIYVT